MWSNAFRVLALGLPVVVLTSAIIGILEAHQCFGRIAAVRVPLGVLTFVAPLFVLQYSPNLAWATASLLVARVAAATAYFLLAANVRCELKRPCMPRRVHMEPLFKFGGWLTVTNIVGYEVISRTQILSQAVMGVMFPALTFVIASNRGRLADIYGQMTDILLLLMLPVIASLFLLAPEALDLWLGPDFSEKSAPVAQWIALGWLINALAKPPHTLLQSAGRPDLVAKAHLTELFPYMVLLWFLTSTFGITGAAAAWAIRVLVDALILNEMARRRVPEIHPVALRTYGMIFMVIALFAMASLIEPLLWRGVFLVLVAGYAMLRVWPIVNQLILPARIPSSIV